MPDPFINRNHEISLSSTEIREIAFEIVKESFDVKESNKNDNLLISGIHLVICSELIEILTKIADVLVEIKNEIQQDQ